MNRVVNMKLKLYEEGSNLEKCLWKETVENNLEGRGTSFDPNNLSDQAKICYDYCNGYGKLTGVKWECGKYVSNEECSRLTVIPGKK